MANKKTLKGYFETGDVPNQSQYHKLINSNLNLNETGTQTITGSLIVSQSVLLESDLTASGNIWVGSGSSANINVEGHITASGNISASGTSLITAQDLTLDRELIVGNNITALGNISASGDVIGFQLSAEARISSNNRVAAYNTDNNNFIANETHPTTIHGTNINLNAPATASIISASGTIIAPTINATNYLDSTGIYHLLTVNGTTLRIGQDSITSNISAVSLNVLGHITASGNISGSNLNVNRVNVNRVIIEADPNNSSQAQLDMNSPADSIINMYMGGVLNTSFHSRGNIDSFVEAGTSIANFGVGTITPAEKLTVHGNISGSGNLKIDGSQVDFTNLPTSDPSVAGRLWNDSGNLKISEG